MLSVTTTMRWRLPGRKPVSHATDIFVYGTLRPGDAEWARSGYTAPPEPATAVGTLYDYGPFPYFSTEGDTTIVGAVLHLDSKQAHVVWRVEVGAGYKPTEIEVTMADGSKRTLVTYEVDERHSHVKECPVITSGDWVEWDARRWAAEEAELGPV
jgi:gamma-glutamylcyclotransferase (GGCT)/AIG2-like uncharacterized protein YtfP